MTSSNVPIIANVSGPTSHADPEVVASVRGIGFILAAGLLAGLISWFVTESFLTGGLNEARDDRDKIVPLASEVGLRDARMSYGVQGALLGLGLGLVGGLSFGQSVLRPLIAGGVGVVLGGLVGAGVSTWLVPIFFDNLSSGDLTYSLKVNGGIWGAVGAIAGLAFGIGRGGTERIARMTVTGFAAGALAMALYIFLGSMLLPRAMTEHPLSLTPESRLTAQLSLALLVAVGLAISDLSEIKSARARKTASS